MTLKYQKIFIILVTFLLFIGAIPIALAKTRGRYLITFILNNEIDGRGFSNALDEDNTVSLEATAYALDILDSYDRNPNDIDILQDNLEDDIKDMFDADNVNLYDLYSLIKSLKILDSNYSIEAEYFDKLYKYLNDTNQLNGGFSYSNSSTSVSLTSTYYAIQIYDLIEKPIENLEKHKSWVLSCNNSDGGYGGNSSLTSTLLNTYFTVHLLNQKWNINDLVDINMTLTYIKSFYVEETSDVDNFGGYLPENIGIYALLSSTYFSVKAISIIDPDELNIGSTINWVLDRQNFQDGGFVDNSGGYEQKVSSVITTFFAFETLKILNPSLSSLSKEIWMVEFNFWILGIILGSIGVIIAVIVYILRKRRI